MDDTKDLPASAGGTVAQANAGSLMSAVAAVLPVDKTGEPYGPRRLTSAWLNAHAEDLTRWLLWCRDRGVDPLTAKPADVHGWRQAMRHDSPSASMVARRLATVRSWYSCLADHNVVARNPVPVKGRPRVDPGRSPAVVLSRQEATAFLTAARHDKAPRSRAADKPLLAARNRALLACMLDLNAGVSEITAANVNDLERRPGRATITLRGKGSRQDARVLVPDVAALVNDYLRVRAEREGANDIEDLSGSLFVTSTGRRMDRWAVIKLIRRMAEAARIPGAGELTPHSLRRAFTALAIDAGAALRDVQDAMGHEGISGPGTR